MRLSNLLIVFVIHACLSLYIISQNTTDYSVFGSILLFPVRQFINITGIELFGYMAYVPYLLNSFIWSFLINYFYVLLKNTVRDRFD